LHVEYSTIVGVIIYKAAAVKGSFRSKIVCQYYGASSIGVVLLEGREVSYSLSVGCDDHECLGFARVLKEIGILDVYDQGDVSPGHGRSCINDLSLVV
jgi:hypothetical protein